VFVWIDASWLAAPDSDQGIVHWARDYVHACYDTVGVADIISSDETRMVWDEDAAGYEATSSNLVYTFRRKSDAPCTVNR
jgi:hypothetical protein